MAKIIVFESCKECVCCKYVFDHYMCRHKTFSIERRLDNIDNDFPDWCPLMDTKNHVVVQDDHGILRGSN